MAKVKGLTDEIAKRYEEINHFKAEITRLEEEIAILKRAARLIDEPEQSLLPETQNFADLGAREIILKILFESRKKLTLNQLIAEADKGGKSLESWSNPYQAFYVTMKSLVKQGKVAKLKMSDNRFGVVKYQFISFD